MHSPENAFHHPVLQDCITRLGEDGFVVHYLFDANSAEDDPSRYAVAAIPIDEYQARLAYENSACSKEGFLKRWSLGMLVDDPRFVRGSSAWNTLIHSSEAATNLQAEVMLAEADSMPELEVIT